MTGERAVIDIGSNTVRLVIYGGPLRAPVVLLNEKVTARLGRGVAEDGLLSDKSRKAALTALARYAKLLKVRDVRQVDVVATAAARDAANGAEFLDQVRALGIDPRLLSGPEEATTSATGVIAAFPGAAGIVADLGGGSLELVSIADGQCGAGTTLPFGSLRLPQMRAAGAARFARRVSQAVEASGWHGAAGQVLYLVGGSHRAVAHYAMLRDGHAFDDPHGYTLDAGHAATLCRSIAHGKLPDTVPGVSASRRAALPDTAALLAVMLRELKPSGLVFSSWGLREGLLYGRLDRATRAQDPLLAGVAAFAGTQGASVPVAEAIADWTAGVSRGGDERLRRAATMLALASMRVEPNLRAAQVMEWALQKRWVGIDMAGRAALAAAALVNAGRNGTALARLDGLAPPDMLARATQWGLAIRLCRRFGSGAAPVLAASGLAAEGDELVLSVDPEYAALCTDPVEKDLRNLAESLKLKPAVRVRG